MKKTDGKRVENAVGRVVRRYHARSGRPIARLLIDSSELRKYRLYPGQENMHSVLYATVAGPRRMAKGTCRLENGEEAITGVITAEAWNVWAKDSELVPPAEQKKLGWVLDEILTGPGRDK